MTNRNDSGGEASSAEGLWRITDAYAAFTHKAGNLPSIHSCLRRPEGFWADVRSAAPLSPENRGIVGRVGEGFGQPSPFNAASSMKLNAGDEQTCDC